MNKAPGLRERPGWCSHVVSMDLSIPCVILEPARYKIETPDAQLGAIHSQSKLLIAFCERRLVTASLRKQRGKDEAAQRNDKQCRASGVHTLEIRYARSSQA